MKTQLLADWETHLVMRAQAGEVVAFELLADEHRETMRGLALRMLRNVEDANDAVQEALVKGFRGIGGFHVGKPVLPWLLRITTNCCIDIVRHRKSTESLDQYEHSIQDSAVSAHDVTVNANLREDLQAAIRRLPERYRQIVMLRHFKEMEVGEIAEHLNKPEGTVKSWLFRARMLLRQEMTLSADRARARLVSIQ